MHQCLLILYYNFPNGDTMSDDEMGVQLDEALEVYTRYIEPSIEMDISVT